MDELRKLQLCELGILDEFVGLCEKHGLRYYLVGGTLLGAVRHQGFIPWDDDVDVAMPRADYDQFAEVCRTELAHQYFYQSPETDPYYFLTYAKLRKNGTEVYEERFRDAQFHKGVFIDIFPLDECPKPGPVCHLLFNVLAVMNYRGQVDSGEAYRPYEELSGKIGYAALGVFSPRGRVWLRKKLLRLSKLLSRGEYVACYAGAYGYKKEIYPVFRLGYRIRLERFEGRLLVIPDLAEEILELMYGTMYMKIPDQPELLKHISIEKYDVEQA